VFGFELDEIDTRLNDLEKNLDTTFKGSSSSAAAAAEQPFTDDTTQ